MIFTCFLPRLQTLPSSGPDRHQEAARQRADVGSSFGGSLRADDPVVDAVLQRLEVGSNRSPLSTACSTVIESTPTSVQRVGL
jgi:hypothetical protein